MFPPALYRHPNYQLCCQQMKPPPPSAVPLSSSDGGPSAALLRAAEAWAVGERSAQIAAVLATAGHVPPRFVLMEIPAGSADDVLPHGAVLAECLPGRAAVVMAPQVATTGSSMDRETIERTLLLALDDALREQQIVLAQALTTTRASPSTHAFLSAGYRIAGDLLYLAADLTQAHDVPAPGAPCALELVCHSPDDSACWIPLIDQTYVKTLDCPAVDGLRATSDVLAGYRDIGRPRDDWWFIARHEGQDVGCLILADHHPAHHAELVYMGLIPEMRGRGWGVFLAREAQRITAQSAAQQLVLSVDAANAPAICHYQAAGFQLWEQRTILIKSLVKNGMTSSP